MSVRWLLQLGPVMCEEQVAWSELPVAERSRLRARQGVGMVTVDEARVVATSGDPDGLVDVPADGVTMGEIVMRGNTVMREYFRDPAATAAAFRGGWFHSGDLGVRYPDGYSSCWTGPRTSSFPVARTSPPSRWRAH